MQVCWDKSKGRYVQYHYKPKGHRFQRGLAPWPNAWATVVTELGTRVRRLRTTEVQKVCVQDVLQRLTCAQRSSVISAEFYTLTWPNFRLRCWRPSSSRLVSMSPLSQANSTGACAGGLSALCACVGSPCFMARSLAPTPPLGVRSVLVFRTHRRRFTRRRIGIER